jgi:lysophospholipase L1-like esterase
MPLLDRRSFLTSSIAAIGSAALSNTATAEQPAAKPSSLGDYCSPLPSFKKGSRLLFLGDSITDMKWGRDESDRNHYLGHSYVFLLAARLGVEMPEAGLDFYNRGVSANSIVELRKRWQADAIDMKPDLLSILIGTNDAGRGHQPEAFEVDYRYLLDASRAANPKLRIVLLDPFILQTGQLTNEKVWAKRRAATDKLGAVVAKLAKDFDAVHIKTQEIFDAAAKAVSTEHWMWDGIHPLPQGHELIARNWIQALVLDDAKKQIPIN